MSESDNPKPVIASPTDERRAAWHEAATINLERVEQLPSSSERAALLLETAEIVERFLEDPVSAFTVALRAYWELPTKKNVIAEVERLADLTGQWADVHATAISALEKTPGRTARIMVMLQIADWCANKLGQPEQAIGYNMHVLELDPSSIDAYRNIVDLYGASGQWGDLCTALEAAATAAKDPADRKQFLFILARVLEQHAADPAGACAAYEKICEVEPGHSDALDALERLYTERQDWDTLLDLLKRKLTATKDQEAKAALITKRGEVLSTHLGDPKGAIRAFEDALQLNRGYLPALEALEIAYRTVGQLAKARDVMERQLKAAADDDDRFDLLVRRAKLLEDELWEPDQAATTWEQVLELKPGYRPAFDSLIRLYRKRNRFKELVPVLERAIEARGDDPSVTELHLAIGQVLVDELERPTEAEQWFRKVLDDEPDQLQALAGLAAAQQLARNWEAAETTLRRLLEIRDDDAAEEEICFKLGALAEARGAGSEAAIEHYERVRTKNPEHREALQALHRLYLAIDSLEDAGQVIEAEYGLEESAQKKAALAAELGTLAQRRDDAESARQWLERALLIDEFNVPAARALAAIHLDDQETDKAVALFEMLLHNEAVTGKEELRSLMLTLTRAYTELGRTADALEAARRAQQVAPTDIEALRLLGESLFAAEVWEEALSIYRRLSVMERSAMDDEARAELLYRMAVIHNQLERQDRALSSLKQALALAPQHRPSLELIIDISREQERHADVITYQQQLAACAEDDERFAREIEIGDRAAGQLEDRKTAIEAYEEALRIRPDHRPTLTKLLPLYQANSQWPEVVDVIERIIASEDDAHRKARLYKSAGIVYRNELEQIDRAIECFNSALDADPDDNDVFDTLIQLLIKNEDWQNLERAYGKMLARIRGQGTPQREIELWHAAGLAFFELVQDYAKAAEAFKRAGALDPHDRELQELVASCYVKLPDRSADAIAAYRELIAADPHNTEYYEQLGGLLAKHDRLDEAWTVSAALVALGQTGTEQATPYERRRPRELDAAAPQLTPEQWQNLIAHPDDNPSVARLLAVITRAVVAQLEQPLKAYGVKRRNRVAPDDDTAVARAYYRAGRVLGIDPVPELYVKPGDSMPFSFMVTDPPRTIVGEAFVETHSPLELLFVCADHLAHDRPGRRIRRVITSRAELTQVLLAALKLGAPGAVPASQDNAVLAENVAGLEQRLSSQEQAQLRDAALVLASQGKLPSIERWIAGVEHTACRAALLLCGDLNETIKLVKTHHAGTAGPTIPAKISDLLSWGVSAKHATLRAALGLQAAER